ncbi:MAG: hypothetical protein KJ939_00445 [Nanoarchaeota archaeon]|nr:hypothetical protein [Nanoarchaeota archaeon]
MTKLENFLELEELPIEPRGPNYYVLEMISLPENLQKISKDFNYKLTDKTKFEITDKEYYHTLEIKTEDKKLFVKIAWEGFLRETLALELNNMLTGRCIPYKGYKDIIITDEIKGEWMHIYILNKIRDTREYCYEYGILNEFTRILGLKDRRFPNLIVKKNGEVRNIDFGQSFMYDSTTTLHQINFNLTPSFKNCFEGFEGQRKAQEIIKSNIENNFKKLKAMLDCIDEETMKELNKGYIQDQIEIINPKEIILTYCKINKWDDLVKELQ